MESHDGSAPAVLQAAELLARARSTQLKRLLMRSKVQLASEPKEPADRTPEGH